MSSMKEYEMADVSAGINDNDYFSGGGPGVADGVDVGQQSLLGRQQLRSDEEKGGVGGQEGRGDTAWCGCLSIRFYQQFFQVDTKDVTERWLHSFAFCKREKGFLEVVADNPDAYGPFWNSTSLIFLIALTTNLSSGMAGNGRGYDLATLISSTWVVYGFAAGIPFFLWLALHQIDIPMPFIKVVCTYGYSLGPFLPAVLVCAFPLPYIAFAALGAAAATSGVFLLKTLNPALLQSNTVMAAPVMAGVGLIQGVFALILKLAFF